jgi:hypothetical protein
MPAPPPESDPAMVRTRGVTFLSSLSLFAFPDGKENHFIYLSLFKLRVKKKPRSCQEKEFDKAEVG